MKRMLCICAIAGLVPLAACGDDDGDDTTTGDDMGMTDEDMGMTTDEDMGGGDEDMGATDEDMGATDEDMGAPTTGDFTFNLTSFMPHNGQDVYYSLRDSSGAEVASGMDRVMGGSASFSATGVTVAGETYRISFFADVDDDGTCTAPPTDHVWQLTDQTADAAGDLTVAYAHSTDFTASACDDLP